MPSQAPSQRRTTPAATFDELQVRAGLQAQPALPFAQGKGRTAQQLADRILGILQNVEGFPKSGASVTVYGYRHWNAMITFKPGCVSFKDATNYRAMLRELVENLRGRFEVEIPRDLSRAEGRRLVSPRKSEESIDGHVAISIEGHVSD